MMEPALLHSPESMPLSSAATGGQKHLHQVQEMSLQPQQPSEQGNLAKLASVLLSFSQEGSIPVAPSHNDDHCEGGGEGDARLIDDEIPALTLARLSPSPAKRALHEKSTSSPVGAYAKLQGATWEFYIQKLGIVLGRSPEMGAASAEGVDVFLGPSDRISKKHLRIEYNQSEKCWELYCFGKSGVLVDAAHYDPFCRPIPLSSRTKIVVDEGVEFYFLLPIESQETTTRTTIGRGKSTRARINFNPSDGTNGPTKARRRTSPTTATLVPPKAAPCAEDEEETKLPAIEPAGPPDLIKPQASYACLIAEAIRSTTEKRLTLSGIYKYLSDKYPYFRFTKSGWQNSIRHNLSLNKAFKKVPRGVGEAGKGMFWIVDPQYAQMVDGGAGSSSGGGRRSNGGGGGRSKSVQWTSMPGHGSAPTTPPMTNRSNSSGASMGGVTSAYIPILPTRPLSAAPAMLAPQLLEAAAAVDFEKPNDSIH